MARSHCWRQRLHKSWNTGTVSWCLHRPLPHFLAFLVQECIAPHQSINVNTKAATNPTEMVSCFKKLVQWWCKTYGSNQPKSDLTEPHSMRQNPCPALWLDSKRPRVRANITVLKQKHSSKRLLMTSALLIDPCRAQPASEQLPPAADGNRCRGPQIDTMQRARELQTLISRWVSPQISPLRAQGTP